MTLLRITNNFQISVNNKNKKLTSIRTNVHYLLHVYPSNGRRILIVVGDVEAEGFSRDVRDANGVDTYENALSLKFHRTILSGKLCQVVH